MSAYTAIPERAGLDGQGALGELCSASGQRLFDVNRGVLLGSFCNGCNQRFFPQRQVCPHCFNDGEMCELELGRQGVVYASTVVRVTSSLGHKPPYAYGYVDLPEDRVRLIARFAGAVPETFLPGLLVELSFEAVARDEAGALLAWVFRPRVAI